MNDKIINTTIEILGRIYPVRCGESELQSLQQAAEFLNSRMLEVQNSGKTLTLERVLIITSLNVTHQYLQMEQQKSTLMNKINQRIAHLQEKLDIAINDSVQSELVYVEG